MTNEVPFIIIVSIPCLAVDRGFISHITTAYYGTEAMITTITTITTVTTTITTITALGLTTVIGVIAVAALIALLATRELASAGRSHFCLRITQFASVGILPLFMAFAVIIIVEITRLI